LIKIAVNVARENLKIWKKLQYKIPGNSSKH